MTQTTKAPDRLPRLSTSLDRGREVRIGLVAVLGIALLVIGIPVALALFVGYPLPRSAPSQEWLTQTVTSTLIIKILACVVWVLWAHFTVCVLAEWRALRRGRLPHDLPFGGSSQALARRLVAAALLLAGAATTFGNLASPATQGRQVASSVRTPGVAAASITAADGALGARAAETVVSQSQVGLKSYVVTPPHGRNHDCLWDIAGRTLGDPMRYKEIFALNRDRLQADGGKLVDANLIRPGWQLHLPADAHGPGVQVAHARTLQAPVQPAVPAPAAPSVAPASGRAATPATTSVSSSVLGGSHVVGKTGGMTAAVTGAASRIGGSGTSWNSDLLGGGLMLAGIALALSARRGPYGKVGDDEQALTLAADTELARSLDRALRSLAAARHQQRRLLPAVVLAWASHEDVTLSFAGGDSTDPPAPWRATQDGRGWTCRLADVVDDVDLGATAAPYPGLLSVGQDSGQELFVDVEMAPGLISVGGDLDRVRDLLLGLVAQAVTCAWSDGARATLVGFGDGGGLGDLDPRVVQHVPQLAAVLPELEDEDAELRRLQLSLGVGDVLAGRLARRSRAWQPHLIVLSGPPTTDELHRLQALVGSGRSQFVVLVVGDLLSAGWRFALDGAGQLDLGVLGTHALAHRLDRDGMARLTELVRTAQEQGRAAGAAVLQLTPRAALGEVADRPDPGGTAALIGPESREAAQVAVSLLGPVGVVAPGPVQDGRRELLTEIVVALALHPNGLHDAVLRASIWPRGVSDDIVTAAMSEVADWLGSGPDARARLQFADGRWSCTGGWVDWTALQRVAATAAESTSGGAGDTAELAALLRGIELFDGAAFSATPAGRYGWLAFARAARDARVLATVVTRRAADLLVGQGRETEAEDVLRRGLLLVPTAEPLWRDLLNLLGRRGPDPAAAAAQEMYSALEQHRVWPEPETDALVTALVPGFHPQGPVPAAAGLAG